MGSLLTMSIFVAITIMAEVPSSLAGPFSQSDTIFKPWKVRTSSSSSSSYNFDKKPSFKERKYQKVSHSPPVYRTVPKAAAPKVAVPKAAAPSDDSEVDWSAADMMQRPIDEPEARETDRGLGSPCSYSSDCSSACCLLDRSTKIRSCQPKARMSEKCSNFQVKGDLYVDACPCIRGTNHCNSNTKRCSWWWKPRCPFLHNGQVVTMASFYHEVFLPMTIWWSRRWSTESEEPMADRVYRMNEESKRKKEKKNWKNRKMKEQKNGRKWSQEKYKQWKRMIIRKNERKVKESMTHSVN